MSKPKVLLVEDDQTLSELYKLKLKLADFDMETALNGKAALDILEKFIPDVILLDLLMPVMDGQKFLEKIRSRDRYKDIPVIILTNLSKEEAPKTIWHLGVSSYFVKAHNTPSDLVIAINKLLRLQ